VIFIEIEFDPAFAVEEVPIHAAMREHASVDVLETIIQIACLCIVFPVIAEVIQLGKVASAGVDQGIQAPPAFVDYGFSARPLVMGCAMLIPAEGARGKVGLWRWRYLCLVG
jgi:hypothetical protein